MSPSPIDRELRARTGEALAGVSRRLWSRGFVEATSGNFSVCVARAPRLFLITATGRDKASLGREDVVLVDERGEPVAGEAEKPSAEVRIHARVYEATEAGAVLHAHPPHAVALSSFAGGAGDAIDVRGLELVKAFAGVKDPEAPLAIPVVPNDQDIDRLAAACVAARRPGVPAVVVRGHGVTAWGQDLDEALRHVEAVEALSRLVILRKLLEAAAWRSS